MAEDAADEEVITETKAKPGARDKPAPDANSKAGTGKNKPGVKVAQKSEGH